MNATYQERVLNSPEYCSNCFRRIRVERQRPERGRFDSAVESSRYDRDRRHTSIEFAPADVASEVKGVFCSCGLETAFDRLWDDDDVDRPRFREFVRRVLRAFELQGVSVDRSRFAEVALQRRQDGAGVDEALAAATARGLAVAAGGAPEKEARPA